MLDYSHIMRLTKVRIPLINVGKRWISTDARTNRKEEILNTLHRGFVNVCIGVSIGGILLGIYKTYEHIRYVRPLYKAARMSAEQELLAVGQAIETPIIENQETQS